MRGPPYSCLPLPWRSRASPRPPAPRPSSNTTPRPDATTQEPAAPDKSPPGSEVRYVSSGQGFSECGEKHLSKPGAAPSTPPSPPCSAPPPPPPLPARDLSTRHRTQQRVGRKRCSPGLTAPQRGALLAVPWQPQPDAIVR
eukprot:791341-Rhodomonas_salina.6